MPVGSLDGGGGHLDAGRVDEAVVALAIRALPASFRRGPIAAPLEGASREAPGKDDDDDTIVVRVAAPTESAGLATGCVARRPHDAPSPA